MPFWNDGDNNDPVSIKLEQKGPKNFQLAQGFRYKARDRTEPYPIHGAETDLASVPWPLWWLIASYGMHTKAALLHDTLIEPGPDLPARFHVPRRRADRLLFDALKESGFGDPAKRRAPSAVRRWLMWSAVAVFGTMWSAWRLPAVLFFAHLVGFWTLLVSWILDTWFVDLGQVDLFGWWPWELWMAALVVGIAGFLWAFTPWVDWRLGLGLWPWALFATLFVLPPTVLVVLVTLLVIVPLDFVFNLPRALKALANRDWGGLVDALPRWTPYRGQGRF